MKQVKKTIGADQNDREYFTRRQKEREKTRMLNSIHTFIQTHTNTFASTQRHSNI